MSKWLLFVGLICFGSLATAEIYRSDDGDTVSFSDKPTENAQRVDLSPQSNRYQYDVDYIYDGDTLTLTNGERVRLLNINAPEITNRSRDGEPGGEAAKAWLIQQIGEKPVFLRFDAERRDQYNRLLAHVFLEDERHLNAEMLAAGLASLTIHPPNLLYVDAMQKAEQQARDNKLGIWDEQAYPIKPATPNIETADRRGWHRWQMTPTEIKTTRSYVWLVAGDRLSIRIHQDHLPLFSPPENYLNKTLEVRGWLSRRGNDYYIQARHPSVISE
jgi:endonuclease YncB( thermonuclease family)